MYPRLLCVFLSQVLDFLKFKLELPQFCSTELVSGEPDFENKVYGFAFPNLPIAARFIQADIFAACATIFSACLSRVEE